jgi:hypothetical protein
MHFLYSWHPEPNLRCTLASYFMSLLSRDTLSSVCVLIFSPKTPSFKTKTYNLLIMVFAWRIRSDIISLLGDKVVSFPVQCSVGCTPCLIWVTATGNMSHTHTQTVCSGTAACGLLWATPLLQGHCGKMLILTPAQSVFKYESFINYIGQHGPYC